MYDVLKSNLYRENYKNKIDGMSLLSEVKNESISLVFFDPQYRGILDKLKYGNEGKSRGKNRSSLRQMSEEEIIEFIKEFDRVLKPSSHLFLWVDKFHLCQGVLSWFLNTDMNLVDMIVWDKDKIGMGYRTRRKSEYLIVLQKKPTRAKGIWKNHSIPDVWIEKIKDKIHPHQKPYNLQKTLIESTTNEEDYVLDIAAGSFLVFDACKELNRNFIGGDIYYGEN